MIRLPAAGGCRCGKCRYHFDATPFVSYTCHCRECQKITGTAFLTCMQIPAEALIISSGKLSIDQRTADSGNLLRTNFCQLCSSTLFAENSARPRVCTIHVGSLDHPEEVEVSAHIWIKQKLPWVALPLHHRIFQSSGNWRSDYARDLSRYEG
ncbi:MAG: hypothetical protein ACJAVI_000037 [Candidatus Azotimanducaceae bacterium]|jgi:hypothetical protein